MSSQIILFMQTYSFRKILWPHPVSNTGYGSSYLSLIAQMWAMQTHFFSKASPQLLYHIVFFSKSIKKMSESFWFFQYFSMSLCNNWQTFNFHVTCIQAYTWYMCINILFHPHKKLTFVCILILMECHLLCLELNLRIKMFVLAPG